MRPKRTVARLKVTRTGVAVAVVVAFVIALVAWTLRGPDAGYRSRALPGSSAGAQNYSPSDSAPSGTRSAARSTDASPRPDVATTAAALPLLGNMQQSVQLNGAGGPARSVVLRATSDAAILKLGYLVRGGNPSRGLSYNVASPGVLKMTAHGYGLVAAFGVQASPYATYITCRVEVGGTVMATHTVRGPYGVAVCVG